MRITKKENFTKVLDFLKDECASDDMIIFIEKQIEILDNQKEQAQIRAIVNRNYDALLLSTIQEFFKRNPNEETFTKEELLQLQGQLENKKRVTDSLNRIEKAGFVSPEFFKVGLK